MAVTTVVIVDDHGVVRRGICALLSADPEIQVVGEAATGREAVELVEQLCPDVLLLDVTLPDESGLEVARRLRQRAPGTHIVMLSMHQSEAYVLEALRGGASVRAEGL